MLKKFILNSLSSFVGAWIAIGLFIISIILYIFGIAGNMALSVNTGVEQVKSRSVLQINLSGAISERDVATEPELANVLQQNMSKPQALDVILQSIREAAKNDDIAVVYIKCGALSASPATLNAIRHELLEFKKTTEGKKKILAYGDSFTQGCYFVVSVADEIYMNPAGSLSLTGIGGSNFYMKGLFDKLGIQFQVAKVGTYKSAVEPYILSDMSEPARAQLDTLYGNMWLYIRQQIAESRDGLSADKIDSLINNDFISLQPSKMTVTCGLVDSLIYERDMKKRLADISGREVEKLNIVGPATVATLKPWADAYSSSKQIAVVYAVGEIADGNNTQINYEILAPEIIKLADDDKIKGLVLRVNSPGGSVFGSDQIGEALDYFKSKGKPLSVSMGDYAASGGYWISACADRIIADPLTITGSIGIFGLLPNFKGTLDKLGVNVPVVATNPNANFPSGFQPLNDVQMAEMQKYVERGYDQFVSRVAKGRNMKKSEVFRIAEGRVWDGAKAKQIGLVDSLGYLADAISWTATKAGISSDYQVAAYPKVEPTIWDMIILNSGMSMGELKMASDFRDEARIKSFILNRIFTRKPIQARMPEISVYL